MKIHLKVDTDQVHELLALQAFVNTLAIHRVPRVRDLSDLSEFPTFKERGIDHGTGKIEIPDLSEITVYTSEGNEALAGEHLNVADDTVEVVYDTIRKESVDGDVAAAVESKDEYIETDVAAALVEKKKADAKTKRKARADKKKADAEAATAAATVDVETSKVSVEDGTIEEALNELDPPPPKDAEQAVDAVAIRKAMVAVLKTHGSKGAKMGSTIVREISGIGDVTKIPEEKMEAVLTALQAAAAEPDTVVATPKPDATAAKPDAKTTESTGTKRDTGEPGDNDAAGLDF